VLVEKSRLAATVMVYFRNRRRGRRGHGRRYVLVKLKSGLFFWVKIEVLSGGKEGVVMEEVNWEGVGEGLGLGRGKLEKMRMEGQTF